MKEFTEIITSLQSSLNRNKLPGLEIQVQMIPPGRPKGFPKDKNYIDSAVTILLSKRGNDIYFPLIQRTSNNQNDKHKGQISLPGGKYESVDKTLLNCALRELEEELGVDKSQVNILGELTELYIPVSNFKVQPYVVFSENNFNFVPQPKEVEYILEISLKDLLDNKNLKKGKIDLESGMQLQNVPYFDLNEHVIWGATAMILNEFKNVISNIKTK